MPGDLSHSWFTTFIRIYKRQEERSGYSKGDWHIAENVPSSSLLLYAAPEVLLGQHTMWVTHREGVSWDSINDDRLVAVFC